MQRRAAAIYFVFFLVLGASSYAVIAVAERPAIDLDAQRHAQGDTFRVGGQQYTVEKIETVGGEGGGHGGGGGGRLQATIAWTNSSARFTATLANDSTVSLRNGTYRVQIPNTTDPARFTLREEFNVSAILRADTAVYNETVTIEGTEYVTYRSNDTNVPLEEYLPERDRVQFSEGGTFPYRGNETTVRNVTTTEVLLVWSGEKRNTITVSEGQNATLGTTQYVAHFPSKKRLQLSADHGAYQREVARQDRFHTRMNGFWVVLYLSALGALFIVGLAYLPARG